MAIFIFEAGMSTLSMRAPAAFFIRVIISAIGSVTILVPLYQLDFFIPGISPRMAIFLRHSRQMPNLRYVALGRPQIEQRVYSRTWNFGVLFCLALSDFLAIRLPYLLNGMPKAVRRLRPSSSVPAVVTTVIFIPRALSILS